MAESFLEDVVMGMQFSKRAEVERTIQSIDATRLFLFSICVDRREMQMSDRR